MPAVSQAQQRFLFSQKPSIAPEFAVSGKAFQALPQHVQKFSSNKTGLLAQKKKKKKL